MTRGIMKGKESGGVVGFQPMGSRREGGKDRSSVWVFGGEL